MRYQPRLRSLGPVARVDMVTRVTLFTGLVLVAFTAGHLANHAAGLWSLEAMETGRRLANAVWRGPLGSMLLFGSLTVHGTFGLWRLYRRRSLRLPWWETAQIVTGLAIPFALAAHVLETRMFAATFGVDDGYAYMLLRVWPERAAGLLALLTVSWLHGCLGVHYWLRLRPWYAAARPAALAVAVLLPALAVLGLGRGTAEVRGLAADPAWLSEAAAVGRWPNRFAEAVANTYELYALVGFAAAVALVLAARAVRGVLLVPRGRVRIALGGGRTTATGPAPPSSTRAARPASRWRRRAAAAGGARGAGCGSAAATRAWRRPTTTSAACSRWPAPARACVSPAASARASTSTSRRCSRRWWPRPRPPGSGRSSRAGSRRWRSSRRRRPRRPWARRPTPSPGSTSSCAASDARCGRWAVFPTPPSPTRRRRCSACTRAPARARPPRWRRRSRSSAAPMRPASRCRRWRCTWAPPSSPSSAAPTPRRSAPSASRCGSPAGWSRRAATTAARWWCPSRRAPAPASTCAAFPAAGCRWPAGTSR